ncbi:hypothetical protein [Kitasatospora sp. NPDC051914]|uniref:PH domain-containing protein n=1 Tax=Kitasatospora sp. NPDC051914 TaxID=3154945 RepID=UPI003413296A
MTADRPAGPIRLRSHWQRAVLALCGAVFLVIAVGMVVEGPWGTRLLGLVIGAAASWWTWRAVRLGVTLDETGVASHGMERTHRTPWCTIASVSAQTLPGPGLGTVTTLVLTRYDGEPVALRGIAGYASDRNAARMRELQDRMEALRTAHRAGCESCPAGA